MAAVYARAIMAAIYVQAIIPAVYAGAIVGQPGSQAGTGPR